MNTDLTHFDHSGASRMVDTSEKPVTLRTARASGRVRIQPETMRKILDRTVTKGDVLNTARLAGIQAAKRTGELIPLCHPLNLSHVDVDLVLKRDRVAITATSVAALTIYDMCKAVDKTMVIGEIRLVSKRKE